MDIQRQEAGDDAGTHPCGFSPPDGEENRRRVLTPEALAIIGGHGAAALGMRALAARLGMVPAALYRHVHSKDQLYDLILDGVLAEVDCQAGPALPWTGQVTALAHRLRTVGDHVRGLVPVVLCQNRVLRVATAVRACALPDNPRTPR